jgi:hypothetical protein
MRNTRKYELANIRICVLVLRLARMLVCWWCDSCGRKFWELSHLTRKISSISMFRNSAVTCCGNHLRWALLLACSIYMQHVHGLVHTQHTLFWCSTRMLNHMLPSSPWSGCSHSTFLALNVCNRDISWISRCNNMRQCKLEKAWCSTDLACQINLLGIRMQARALKLVHVVCFPKT